MQQLIAWVIAITLFVSMLVTSILSYSESFYKRRDKQDINLIGKEIVNHVYISDQNEIVINETSFIYSVAKLMPCADITGCVFVYDSYIIGIDQYSTYTQKYLLGSDDNKQVLVNRAVNEITKEFGGALEIQIGKKDNDAFFNCLEDCITVFLITKGKRYFNVSGYTIQISS